MLDFDDKILVAQRIKDMCDSEKMTVKQFSEVLGLNEKTVGTYARGIAFPTWGFLTATHNYGFNVEYLLTGTGEMYRANRTDQPRDDATTQPYAPRQQTGGQYSSDQ